jgi:hypothetical protein
MLTAKSIFLLDYLPIENHLIDNSLSVIILKTARLIANPLQLTAKILNMSSVDVTSL